MNMSDIAIRVENLSKLYHIGMLQQRNDTLRDALTARFRRNPKSKTQNPKSDELWALRDVSFEVKPGEVVGIIGRNGAGKSTLLKILSRITEPTSGRAEIHGRVGSLLEVGTGFHPELTGRENIYLNGAILGMRRIEIDRLFEEIVAFAEIERFLDTPVKRYSSGMYVRLAFAVAAHLEPEILVVDEVLAVGDSEFQTKCMNRMGKVAGEGRTILFVSHNMAAISNLCTQAVLLRQGQIAAQGSTASTIDTYLNWTSQSRAGSLDLTHYRLPWAQPLIKSIRVLDLAGKERIHFAMQSDIVIEMEFDTEGKPGLRHPAMGVVVNHSTRGTVGGINTRMTGFRSDATTYHRALMRCTLKAPALLQGHYSVDVWLGDGAQDCDAILGALHFAVELTDVYNTGRTPFESMGVMFFQAKWDISEI